MMKTLETILTSLFVHLRRWILGSNGRGLPVASAYHPRRTSLYSLPPPPLSLSHTLIFFAPSRVSDWCFYSWKNEAVCHRSCWMAGSNLPFELKPWFRGVVPCFILAKVTWVHWFWSRELLLCSIWPSLSAWWQPSNPPKVSIFM